MMVGQSRDHMKEIAPLGAAARWPNGPTDMMTDEAVKSRARAAVKRAVETGKLIRPPACPRCKQPERFRSDGRSLIHAHHHRGYEFPLDVEWLCIDCHFVEDPRPSETRNGRAKIDWPVVRAIRQRYRPGVNRHHCGDSARSLAREFGLSDRTVHRIIRGEIWIDAALAEGE